MNDVVVEVSMALLLIGGAMLVHLIEWRMYSGMRSERDRLRSELNVMTATCGGWQSVAERALLVAQLGKRVSVRATRVATAKAQEGE